jgi:hypothetical protein
VGFSFEADYSNASAMRGELRADDVTLCLRIGRECDRTRRVAPGVVAIGSRETAGRESAAARLSEGKTPRIQWISAESGSASHCETVGLGLPRGAYLLDAVLADLAEDRRSADPIRAAAFTRLPLGLAQSSLDLTLLEGGESSMAGGETGSRSREDW